jgi:hypothetical protein
MRFATPDGPLPFAETFVPDPRRDQYIVSSKNIIRNRREHDLTITHWGYFGLFYSDCTKPGTVRADA